MGFAAIADVHGNALALEAVLADIDRQGIADVVNLGDHVSGPLAAAATADILMARDFITIRGDQDRRLVALAGSGRRSRRIDFGQLTERHISWLAGQPASLVYRDDVFACHGTPICDSDYWLEEVTETGRLQARRTAAIVRLAEGISASLFLCAHSHLPRIVDLPDGRMVVNPGSVGCPAYRTDKPRPHTVETGTPEACYAIIDGEPENWQAEIRHVAYDAGAMAAVARDNGSSDWARAIATGRLT